MERQLIGQVTTFGHLDRVDFADEVGNRRIGGRQLFAITGGAVNPRDRGVVAEFQHQILGVLGNRVVGIVEDLGADHDGQPLVEQSDHGPNHAGLGLTALAEEDHVVTGQDGVLELRENRVFVAKHAFKQRLTRGNAGDRIATDLFLDRNRSPTGCFELTERGGNRMCRHGMTLDVLARNVHSKAVDGSKTHKRCYPQAQCTPKLWTARNVGSSPLPQAQCTPKLWTARNRTKGATHKHSALQSCGRLELAPAIR